MFNVLNYICKVDTDLNNNGKEQTMRRQNKKPSEEVRITLIIAVINLIIALLNLLDKLFK